MIVFDIFFDNWIPFKIIFKYLFNNKRILYIVNQYGFIKHYVVYTSPYSLNNFSLLFISVFGLNPHIHNPDGDPYPGLAYFIILYEPIRIGIFLDIIGYDL